MTPIVLSTRSLKPTTTRDAPAHCVSCQQPQAYWRVQHARYGAEAQPICALCFLRTSGWLETHKEQFDLVVNVIGLRRNKALERDEAGGLVHPKDADDVLGAVVLHDRLDAINAFKQKLVQRGAE